ncbi:UvrD-helicase domain-containing protein [Pseudonocardia spinosispora]|uniref:UvrD-helicase domain-containing protein n=1 Tax=Pseudonocardia spinosispora TaxID=103441 RepID=UPI000403E5E7|nr:UvrD-helicase domain-containing protein [Pseudonocardia spinosispora]
MSRHEGELREEQTYLVGLYKRLDAERVWVSKALDAALQDSGETSLEARWLRDAAVDTWSDRKRRLRVADSGLCFGRIDTERDGPLHVGRIGLSKDDTANSPEQAESTEVDVSRSLLIDWRAPVARPFYTATGANPEGISRRRRFRTRGRALVDFADERFGDNASGEDDGSDAALLAAISEARSDGMRDIVATIQAAQDEVIRLGSTGVVVVEGGPGTGKTAVALHRVAYLLYEHRERMARRGVLLVGPNPGFLDYVSGVLPALGETDVVFTTLGTLMPGVRTARQDGQDAARIKGSEVMVEVLEAAVLDRQRIPHDDDPIEIELDDVTLWLDAEIGTLARDAARASRLVHNQARAVFDHHVIEALTLRAVAKIGAGWLNPEQPDPMAVEVAAELGEAEEDDGLAENLTADVRAELSGSIALAAELDELWPMLTPQRLLAELFSSRDRLEVATTMLSSDDREALYRENGRAWTVSDVPLLDEAVDMLGSDGTEEGPADYSADYLISAEDDDEEPPVDPEELDYAEGVLEILDTEEDPDEEVLRAVDLMAADQLAERQGELDLRSLAERASSDRNWTYGHVVVDEAQELSEMDWRALMRRCPTRSMTIVGDLAQRESPAGAGTWSSMLDKHVPERWAYRQLTVNYRTPADIMDVAASVLAEVDPSLRPPASVRRTGVAPWAREVAPGTLADGVRRALGELTDEVEGTVAVIAPSGTLLPTGLSSSTVDGRDVAVLTPHAAKGLEFDAVVLCEPERMLDGSRAGAAELYVSLTRATQRLGVLHSTPLPRCLSGLRVDVPQSVAS